MLAAFPANLLFPLAVIAIVDVGLAGEMWAGPLMMLGAQWYILFNVIAGAAAFPRDLREAAATLHLRGRRWLRAVILPGIFPYFLTGMVTAAGGAWNASIVAEYMRWGATVVTVPGIGSYITRMTQAGDTPRVILGLVVMSRVVTVINRLVWRRLHIVAERHWRVE